MKRIEGIENVLSLLSLLDTPQAQHPEADKIWNDNARQFLATLDAEQLKTFAANSATLANMARRAGRELARVQEEEAS